MHDHGPQLTEEIARKLRERYSVADGDHDETTRTLAGWQRRLFAACATTCKLAGGNERVNTPPQRQSELNDLASCRDQDL